MKQKRKDMRIAKPSLVSWMIGAFFCLLVFVIIAFSIAPKQHDLVAGDIAPVTITATKAIEDEFTYEKDLAKAEAMVVPKTVRDAAVEERALINIRSVLDKVSKEHELFDPLFSSIRDREDFLQTTESYLANEEMIEAIRERIGLPLESSAIRDLLRVTSSELRDNRLNLLSAVNNAYNNEIVEEALPDAKRDIESQLNRLSLSEAFSPLRRALLDEFFLPNSVFDEALYEADLKLARETVKPRVYNKGENIIREGERVDEAQYHLLLDLGLLNERVDLSIYFGLAAIIALLALVLGLFLAVYEPEVIQRPRMLLLVCVIILLHTMVSAAATQINAYMIPLQFGVLLIAILIKPRLALVVNIVLCVMTGIIANGGDGLLSTTTSNILIVGLIGGCQAVYLTRKPLQRAGLFLVGLATGLIDMAVLLALGLMTTSNVGVMIAASLWSAVGGILSGILSIGLMPIFENVFHLLTPPRLLELSNPNQPLLKRLLLEAPGTYHHAIMVANLAEAAVDRVGGNPLLTRVSAYYHDVGKLKRPYYFGENQLGGENPHDRMEPLVSAATLTAHTGDGAKLAEAARLPEPIIDIIRQHHGDSVTQFFYAKAIERYGEDEVHIGDYRYTGPTPQTREAAIVMLADVVEAAVRSLKDRSPEVVEPFVKRLIRNKLEDGQLDSAPLTLRDIDEIIRAFCKVLAGMYHERVAYPDIEVNKHVQRT